MTVLIGLGGALRSGKDAVADHLVERHGFVKLGMSDALHDAMLALDPIVDGSNTNDGPPDFERYSDLVADIGYVEAKKVPEVRRLLQKLGTEVGRDMIGPTTWTDIAARKINTHLQAGDSVVITGIRFLEELGMVRSFAGTAVWMDRPSEHVTSAHASENSLTAAVFDKVIVNDGTLTDLYGKVDVLLGSQVHA